MASFDPSLPGVTSASVTMDDSVLFLWETTRELWLVFPPVLLVLGTCGNALSVAVLCRKAMRRSNAVLYLILLAVVDTLVLYTGLLRQWLLHLTYTDIREFSPLACKIHTWMLYSTLDLSVWILVALTLERLVSVCMPHRVKRHCNTLTSCVLLSVISVILLVVNSHFLYGMGDAQDPTNATLHQLDRNTSSDVVPVRYCSPLWKEYQEFSDLVWPWIDLCLYSLVPLSLIIICNSAIIIKVCVSRKNARRIMPSAALPAQSSGQPDDIRSRKVSSMTATLVTLNLVLLLTTMPISAYLIVQPYVGSSDTAMVQVEMSLTWAIVNMLMYTNNSINFLLYCMSGSRFREELLNMFRRNRKLTPVTVINTQMTKCRDTRLRVTGSLRIRNKSGHEMHYPHARFQHQSFASCGRLQGDHKSADTVVLQGVYLVSEDSVGRQLQQPRLHVPHQHQSQAECFRSEQS